MVKSFNKYLSVVTFSTLYQIRHLCQNKKVITMQRYLMRAALLMQVNSSVLTKLTNLLIAQRKYHLFFYSLFARKIAKLFIKVAQTVTKAKKKEKYLHQSLI